MRRTALARRYAEAAADVAEQSDALRRVAEELNVLAEAVGGSDRFRYFAVAAPESREEKRQLLGELSRRLGLCEVTSRLLGYLVTKKRLLLLPELARSFAEEADRRLGIATAHVRSARPLSEGQREQILEKLEGITGMRIRAEMSVDESLIAGFQVRLDGKFYDGSLQGRLRRARERIAYGV